MFVFPRSGAIHSHEGSVHEERSGLRSRVFNHSAVHIQRPAGLTGADPTSKGHRGRKCGRKPFEWMLMYGCMY